VFERFTEQARQVIVFAQEEARGLRHNYIGTEHMLLGLLREQEGLAARVLGQLDITVERVRAQMLRVVSAGEETVSGQIPFTPRAKKVLELALREALGLGHNYIGTEHILLGLVRENDGVAMRILRDLGVNPEKVRDEVVVMLSAAPSGTPPMVDRDRSAFDFTSRETSDLATWLAPLSSEITLEVRHHGDQPPTFRVSCWPLAGDGTLSGFVQLESVGIRAVLDAGTRVRLRHLDEPAERTSGDADG
jgi:ATP-dependent Clp protease ATP-binding subunit ClpA